MNLGDEAAVCGDAFEQAVELSTFGVVERVEQLEPVFRGDAADLSDGSSTLGRQLERMIPAVGSTALASEQPAFSEVIDEADQAAP